MAITWEDSAARFVPPAVRLGDQKDDRLQIDTNGDVWWKDGETCVHVGASNKPEPQLTQLASTKPAQVAPVAIEVNPDRLDAISAKLEAMGSGFAEIIRRMDLVGQAISAFDAFGAHVADLKNSIDALAAKVAATAAPATDPLAAPATVAGHG